MASHAKNEIQQMLKFFSIKRDLYVAEIDSIFKDFNDERLADDMYSKDDVESLLKDLRESCRERVRRDLETTAAMAGLLLDQVAGAAEMAGVTVALDVTRTEDAAALDRMRAFNSVFFADVNRRGAAAGGAGALGAGGGGINETAANLKLLDSLRDEHAKLGQERDRLTAEGSVFKERYTTMQAQCTGLLREKGELSARVAALDAEIKSLRSGAGAAASASEGNAVEVGTLRDQLTRLSAQVEALRTENMTIAKERDARLDDSKQFQQLKKMMQKKNTQLAEMRTKLAKYEPDSEVGGGGGEE